MTQGCETALTQQAPIVLESPRVRYLKLCTHQQVGAQENVVDKISCPSVRYGNSSTVPVECRQSAGCQKVHSSAPVRFRCFQQKLFTVPHGLRSLSPILSHPLCTSSVEDASSRVRAHFLLSSCFTISSSLISPLFIFCPSFPASAGVLTNPRDARWRQLLEKLCGSRKALQ